MVIVDCPWCEAPVALERQNVVRCEDCRIEVELDATPVANVALAA